MVSIAITKLLVKLKDLVLLQNVLIWYLLFIKRCIVKRKEKREEKVIVFVRQGTPQFSPKYNQTLTVDINKIELFIIIADRLVKIYQNITKIVSTTPDKVVSNQLIENQNLLPCSKDEVNDVCSFTLKT